MKIMVIILIAIYIVSVIILRIENKYTWASSVLEKPIGYETQKIWWMLIPKLLAWVSSILLFFQLNEWLDSVAITIGLIALYSFLNKYFTKKSLLQSINKMYPAFLEGILENYDKRSLSDAEKQDKINFAKVLALQEIWCLATGKPANADIMNALFRRLGWPQGFSKYHLLD